MRTYFTREDIREADVMVNCLKYWTLEEQQISDIFMKGLSTGIVLATKFTEEKSPETA